MLELCCRDLFDCGILGVSDLPRGSVCTHVWFIDLHDLSLGECVGVIGSKHMLGLRWWPLPASARPVLMCVMCVRLIFTGFSELVHELWGRILSNEQRPELVHSVQCWLLLSYLGTFCSFLMSVR